MNKNSTKVSKNNKKPLSLEKETVKALNVKTGVQAGRGCVELTWSMTK